MKYMGSKARIAKHILPIILKDRTDNQWYVEPFAGGMNMIMHVTGKRIANDINFYLIEMWKELLNGWVPEKVSRDAHTDVKRNTVNYDPYYVGWVRFNCSFGGDWFGGFAGETKTKLGTVRDYQAEAIRNVLKQVKYLRGVKLHNKEYYDLYIPDNSIIYCDPPYEGTTKYANDFDHVSFWDWVRLQHNKGHTVFVSEYAALSANGKSGGNKNSVEKLFTLQRV